MPNHITTLGFNVQSREDFEKLAEIAHATGIRVKTKHGYYAYLHINKGIELWLQINKKNEVIGLNPHFVGSSRMKIGITNEILSDSNNELDGTFHAWAEPDELIESGSFPFVFDIPNRGIYGDILFPQVLEIQLSAFAHELTIHSDEAEFIKSQDSEIKFAAESFIPSGLFNNGDTPTATAIFTGRIIETADISNDQSKINFAWALVKTLGGEIDVVIDKELVNSELIVGGIISGSFWLSAKFLNEPLIREKSLFQKLLFRK